MKRVVVSTPGKLVLGGEYAVLHGYPAVAAALSRRASVTLEPAGDDVIECETRGFRPGRWRLRETPDGGIAPDDANAPLVLLQRAWETVRPQFAGGARLTLDTADFVSADGRKLGIGSSAALCVALVAALARAPTSATALGELATSAHRAFQGGGSGIDVACAVHGGVIVFREGAVQSASPELPRGLHCAVLWSGQPVSTPERIGRLARDLRRPTTRASLAALGRRAESLALACSAEDAQVMLDALAEWTAALEQFDRACDLGIFAGGFSDLAARARHDGLVCKPCGAGGGDVGAVLATDPGRLAEFVARAEQAGFSKVGVELGAPGVTINGDAIC